MIARRLAALLLVVGCGAHERPPVAAPAANVAVAHPSSVSHTLAEVGDVVGIALDEHHVYVRTSDVRGKANVIGRVERTGSEMETIAATTRGTAIGVTPGFVWWIEGTGVARARKGTTKVEHLSVGFARVDHLASSGGDVWIAAGGDTSTERLLVFAEESATAREVLDFGTAQAPFGFAAADGEVVASGAWRAYSVVRDGKLVHLETGNVGASLVVGGDRMATASSWLQVHPLDGGAPRHRSELRGLAAASPGCFTADLELPDRIEVVADLAGGGGRLALVIGQTPYARRASCRSSSEPPEIIDGTAAISLIAVDGAIEPVATGEDVTLALAVDAHGVVWSTRTQLRAVDR